MALGFSEDKQYMSYMADCIRINLGNMVDSIRVDSDELILISYIYASSRSASSNIRLKSVSSSLNVLGGSRLNASWFIKFELKLASSIFEILKRTIVSCCQPHHDPPSGGCCFWNVLCKLPIQGAKMNLANGTLKVIQNKPCMPCNMESIEQDSAKSVREL